MKEGLSNIKDKILIGLVLQTFFIFLPVSNTFAQSIQVKAYFDTTAILIGDQIHLNFFVDQPPEAKVNLPVLKDTIADKIEILSPPKTDTMIVGNGRLRILQRYLITCFDSGVYLVPALKFAFHLGAITDTITTVPLVLAVNTIEIKDSKKFYDIKGIAAIPYTFAEILPYILIAIGALLLIALIIYIYIRLKNKKPIFPFQKPVEPPHVIAFRDLEKIKREKLWQKGQLKEYFTGLTDIIRTYMEGRFKILAMESTSDEIISEIKNIEIVDSKSLNELKQLLVTADLVKFAKSEPLPDENENSWQYAYNFVLTTCKDEPIIEQNTLQGDNIKDFEKNNKSEILNRKPDN